MKEKMDNLVQGLREELIQYGEMLTCWRSNGR